MHIVIKNQYIKRNLILEYLASGTVRNALLLYISYRVQSILVQQPKETKKHLIDNLSKLVVALILLMDLWLEYLLAIKYKENRLCCKQMLLWVLPWEDLTEGVKN